MKTETKYNKNDEVWFMQDNKLCKNTVDSFEIKCEYHGGPNGDLWGSITFPIKVSYYITDKDQKRFRMKEEELFESKEQLINSLL